MSKISLAFLLAFVIAGCSRFATDYDPAVSPETSRDWVMQDVVITIPDTLTVSEDNKFAPRADIVWHGELEGDRRAQVTEILKEGIQSGASGLSGTRPVTFSVVLREFHAVTPKSVSRAPGAVHNISYILQAFDAETGEALTPVTDVTADFEALTRSAAVVAAAEGRTQRVRIIRHVALVTEGWLGIGPDPRRSFVAFGR